MPTDINEREYRVRQQSIVVEREQRRLAAAIDARRFGTKRIVANAREEIAKMKLACDEARFTCRDERQRLELYQAELARGFEA